MYAMQLGFQKVDGPKSAAFCSDVSTSCIAWQIAVEFYLFLEIGNLKVNFVSGKQQSKCILCYNNCDNVIEHQPISVENIFLFDLNTE